MDEINDFSRDQFLILAKTAGLFPEGPYREKLFNYVKNILARNKVLYEIDVNDVEPMSIVSYLGTDKK